MAETSKVIEMLRQQAAEPLPGAILRELDEWKLRGYRPTAILMSENLFLLLLDELEGTLMNVGREGEPVLLFDLPIKGIGGVDHWEIVTTQPWERG